MKGVYIGSLFIFISSTIVFGQINEDYRSRQTGNWNTVTTWQVFNAAVWHNLEDAGAGAFQNVVPTSTSGVITLQAIFTVTVTAGVTVDQVTIQSGGTLTINSAIILTLGNAIGDEITVDAGGVLTNNGTIIFGNIPLRTVLVNGTLNNSGSFTGVSASKLIFASGSNYFHQFANGGTIPAAAWNSNSTVNIVGYTAGNSTAPSGLTQTFHHFVWNAPGQNVTISLGGLPTNINGDFRIESTGIDVVYYSLGGAGNTMNIGGNFDINGGTLGWTSGDAAVSTLNVSGNMDISGGSYVQFADDKNLTINLTGNFALSGTAQIDFSALTATTDLNVQGNYSHSGGDIFVNGGTGNINFTGASTKIFTSTLVPTGAVNYSVASLSTLTLSGSNFVGGGGTFTLNGTLEIGSTNPGGALQTGTAAGNLRVSGIRTYSSNSTIVYNGTGGQFIGNGFPSGGDVNLTINNSSNVTLSSNLDIVALRTLTLTSGNIVIGAQTLTINGTVTGSGGIVGGASSNLMIGGTGNFGTLTFSGTNQLNNFTLNRTASGLVTLGGNLTILGTFTHTAGTLAIASNTFTISGAYGPAFPAVPGNFSVTNLSSIIVDGTGTLPSDVGLTGTALGTLTLNRAAATLATTSSITINNLNLLSGTFSNGVGIAIGTGGTITREGGTMTASPNNTTNSYNVVYTSGAITSGPELPTNTTALANLSKTNTGTVTLGSNITINGILTLSSGSFNAGTNTIDLKGNFVSSAASTLTSSPVTFSGTTTISGTATPTFGTITISGTLTPSSSFQINGNLANNGILNAGSGTTIFGGTTTISGTSTSSFNNLTISSTLTAPTGSFNVAGTWTNNGTFNAGVATNTVTFNGTSSIAGSSATNFSGVTVSGTLTAPATLNVAGNFTNNGIFTRGTGTVVFNGSSIQNIQGSAVTDFNNINVTNAAGPPAVLVQNNTNLRGALTLAANSIFDADGSDNTSVFTLISTGDNPTVDAGIATLPTGASVSGNVTVQRYMAIEGGTSRIYRYIASPVQTPPVSQIQAEIPVTGSFTGSSACSGCLTSQSMFSYDESVITGDLNTGYVDFPDAANTETLATGRGYTIYVRGNIAPVSTAGTARWDVTAPINSGTVSFPATFTSSGTPANDGWNLVGNPYPSTIDWDAAGWTKTNINNAIYMRDNGAGVVASYVGGVGLNGGTRYIGLGQGFFVQSTASPTFSATESVKAAGTQTTFFREQSINDILRITLRQGNTRDESVVRFTENATADFDGNWDAHKLKNETFNLSSITAGGLKLAINALPKITCGATVNLNISDVTQGAYQIEFSEFESFGNEIEISVYDGYTNTKINPRVNSSYAFEVTADSLSFGNKRFSVSFSNIKPVDVQLSAPTQVCQGQQAFIGIANSENFVSYSVYRNGNVIAGPISGNGGALQIPIEASKFLSGDNGFILQYSPANCSSMITSKQVNIKSLDIPSITAANGDHCGSGSVSLTATGADNGNYRWYETETDNIAIAGAAAGTYATPVLNKSKTYYVSAVNALGCEGARKAVMAIIHQYNEVTISLDAGQNKLTSSYETGNQWYFNGVAIPGATDKTLEANKTGLYEVEVKISGCSTRASWEMVILGVENDLGKGVKFFPNPVKDQLTIELNDKDAASQAMVYNSIGQPLGTIQFKSSGNQLKGEYNFTGHTMGVYLIKLIQGKKITHYKIIKK